MRLFVWIGLVLLMCEAFVYGYAVSMTSEGFPIAGYIGALIPVVFTGMGVLTGMWLMRDAQVVDPLRGWREVDTSHEHSSDAFYDNVAVCDKPLQTNNIKWRDIA